MHHASAPAWTKTPLFVELSVLKQQVVVLTDDNVRLSGVAQRMTATCSALSKEVHRLKVAFAALTDLLDAEVASLRTDGTKLWQEVASLKEVGPPIWEELKSNAAAIERQRVAAARLRQVHPAADALALLRAGKAQARDARDQRRRPRVIWAGDGAPSHIMHARAT